MRNKRYSLMVLVILTGTALVAADFLVLLFFGYSFQLLLSRLGLPAVVFFIVYSAVLGRNAKCFAPDYFQNRGDAEYDKCLKKIGAVPIKLIGIGVILHLIFLLVVFYAGNLPTINTAMRTPLFLATLSLGMLVGTFLYVTGDGMVFATLSGLKLTRYPVDVREKRQELKFFIVPIVVALMSLLFGCSVAILGMIRAGIMKSGISGSAWSAIQIPIAVNMLCVGAMAVAIKRNLSGFYNSIIKQMENLSSERKDLTRRIEICSVDEIGTISGMVNTFCDHLRDGINDIKIGQTELSGIGVRLEENASGMAASVARISSVAEQVLRKTQGQKESINTSSHTIHRVIENIKNLEESIDAQISSMNQASAAVEEMVGNISSIGSVTEKMASQFETVGVAADEGSRIQRESGERIAAIVKESQALQAANKIIATIAAQTNLLAMNAAIEAAHAGEAGRGFSVVADEIRKLAETSSQESRKISQELKQIVSTIALIVKDSESSGEAFSEVSQRIRDTEKLVIEVNNAVREQKTGASQVMDSLKVMNDLTSKVGDNSKEMTQSNETVLQEIDALKNSAAEISSRMEEMSSGIRNINSGAREVSELAATTHKSIEKISVIADGFHV